MSLHEAERDGSGDYRDEDGDAAPWPKLRVVVMGNEAFKLSWREALGATAASFASDEQGEIDLLIAAETESKRALSLLERCGSLVIVAQALDTATCRKLERPGVLVLPPPLELAGRRTVASWLVERASKSRTDGRTKGRVNLTRSLQVDLDQRALTSGGQTTQLRSGEAAVLRFLLQRAGSWTPTARICVEVFGRTDEAAAKLAWKYISNLRKKLGSEAELLEMDRARGYRLLIATPLL